MVVLSIRYNLLRGHSSGWNREVKHVGGGVVWWWVTDREVWPRLKFDQKLSVISVKNILIERLASQTIQRFRKKFKKNSNFFWKNYKLCRRGYTEGRSYADDQIELHRGASTSRTALGVDYADDNSVYAEGCWLSAYCKIPIVSIGLMS
jgi:hypothetical protein